MVKKKIDTIVEDVKEEANETVGTVTFKRWQVVLIAAAISLGIIVLFF